MAKKTNAMSGAEIYSWVEKMCNDYYNNLTCHIIRDTHKGKVRITNIRTGKTAFAKCNKTDKFNFNVGLAIAWARYKGVTIPDNM